MTKTIPMAIAYDFDGTLSPDYMQHSSFLPSLGIKENFSVFWDAQRKFAQDNDMDEVLSYMYYMLREATHHNKSIRREAFIEHGRQIAFFPGVKGWFPRMNDYAAAKGVSLKHYTISSGLREMIEGTSIRSEFAHVYASGFAYNQDDIAIWPATAVNYTNKTQHLFRISKGIENSWDNKTVNAYMPNNRPIPERNIVYIGDGETDIPAMKMTKHLGGTAIAVYDPAKPKTKEASDLLIEQDRTDHSVAADYREGSELDKVMKATIDRVAAQAALQ